MASIVATLIPDNDLMGIGEDIDDLSLGLIPPLQTNNRRDCHDALSFDETTAWDFAQKNGGCKSPRLILRRCLSCTASPHRSVNQRMSVTLMSRLE